MRIIQGAVLKNLSIFPTKSNACSEIEKIMYRLCEIHTVFFAVTHKTEKFSIKY